VADLASDLPTAQAADAWLAARGGWRTPSLPPILRATFELDTRRARSRSGGIIGLVGAVVALAFYPALASVAGPSAIATVNLLYLGIAIPVTLVASALVLLNPRPALRESLLALPSIVTPAVITYLFIAGGSTLTDLYLVGMILLMLFATVTVQLRFAAAALVACVVTALFVTGVAHSKITPDQRTLVELIGISCAFYMLVANWRINSEQRHTYVLTLRERLRRQVLSQENRALDALARRDPLTGLANRRGYDAWLQASWGTAGGAADRIGLIMVDVDHFKKYNDYYGHPAGDLCLARVAACLREQLRDTTDLVARVGGEEFAVILPGSTAQACVAVAARLREAVASMALPHLGNGRGAVVTISCGCASLYAEAAVTVQELCAAADAALYLAKEGGRNRVCLADPAARLTAAPPPAAPPPAAPPPAANEQVEQTARETG
jgi:diguanylate cyclase (GGDEF)-like protein